MKTTGWVAAALAAGAMTGPARADDAALGTKLDAIEKRLADIEAMEHARGAKPPFAIGVPSGFDPRAMCKTLGYAAATTFASPANVAGSATAVCYQP